MYRYSSSYPPAAVDWRLRGVLTAVKNQGQCESCWAMASADVVASAWAISTGTLLDLSAQQLCDCESGSCCNGGWPEFALDYVVTNGGLDSAADYPYTAANGTCDTARNARAAASITSWEIIPSISMRSLQQAVANQPVIAYVDASTPDFQGYTGGIYMGNCTANPNHAVLVVGYGTETSGQFFWLIKNSWGTAWGEGGYMRLADGFCGISKLTALYPVILDATNICNNLPNPCGSGTCTPSTAPGSYSCSCPEGFSENLSSGSSKCVPEDPCNQAGNPCGSLGSCTNQADGSYTCACQNGTVLGARMDGSATCVSGVGSSGLLTYTAQVGDTCQSVSAAFGMSPADFALINNKVSCSTPIPSGSVVAVNPTPTGCLQNYTVKVIDNGDCYKIVQRNGLRNLPALLAMNPSIDCMNVTTGQQVCVSLGNPNLANSTVQPKCGQKVNLTDSCNSCSCISTTYHVSQTVLMGLNLNLRCDHHPDAPINCTSICVAPIHPDVSNCSSTYRIQVGDTCARVWLSAGLRQSQFMSLNPNLSCDWPQLQVGQPVCVAPPATSDYVDLIPYIYMGNETLNSIAQTYAQKCGPVASPANICWTNHLQDCNQVVNGTLLQIPCRWPAGRYCGCTPTSDVCGWDGRLYSSLCDAICNYATPTYAPNSAGQCNPCAAGCQGRCYGYPEIWAPTYCQQWQCAYPPFPPTTYSCSDYLMECQKCCWGLGYGSLAYNDCFNDCRQYKC
eukprot:SM000172S03048  [mRNA]  locus=s172:45689:49012:+ [translate_table: standard]